MSNYAEYVIGRRGYGKLTQTAGTVISRLIEPRKNAWTRITGVLTTTAATAHLLTLLRPLGRTTFSAVAAAGQAVVTLTADPGAYPSGVRTAADAITSGDYVVYEAADGTLVQDTAAGTWNSTTGALTLNTFLPTGGVLVGGRFWYFGLATDTNPNDAQAHPRWNLLANTSNFFGRADGMGSIPDNPLMNLGKGEEQPLLLQIDNGSNASTLESVGVEYVKKAAAG